MIKLIEKEPSLEFVIPVLKWLKDPESVSLEERKAIYKAAYTAVRAAAYDATAYAAYAAYAAVRDAAAAAYVANAAEYWVNKYFGTVSITREEVEAQLFKDKEMKHDNDVVQNPKHYELFEDTQVIEIIANSMSAEAFHGYCLGNTLKYRLRAGNKDDVTQDIAKADKYKELYEDFKHLCK